MSSQLAWTASKRSSRAGQPQGTRAATNVILAGIDRVAIDAVGVAILRLIGTTAEVSRGRVFEQEQIARAVELGLGVAAPEKIRFVTGDAGSAAYAAKIMQVLHAQVFQRAARMQPLSPGSRRARR